MITPSILSYLFDLSRHYSLVKKEVAVCRCFGKSAFERWQYRTFSVASPRANCKKPVVQANLHFQAPTTSDEARTMSPPSEMISSGKTSVDLLFKIANMHFPATNPIS